jgi:16S rRNA pseudouridine516 synthase
MRIVRLIANLGYGSRKDVQRMIRDGRITDAAGAPVEADSRLDHGELRLDGAKLDPAAGFTLMLNKPTGYTCSTKDPGRIVYTLLPERFRLRKPALSTIGRLDRDTSGLLLFTDDGGLSHRVTSPRSRIDKIYDCTTARDIDPGAVEIFAGGELMLDSETTPLLPAKMEILGPRQARLTISEGRYHQVRRMFAAIGNHVETLHRPAVGGLDLGDLPSGKWRICDAADIARLFAGSAPL